MTEQKTVVAKTKPTAKTPSKTSEAQEPEGTPPFQEPKPEKENQEQLRLDSEELERAAHESRGRDRQAESEGAGEREAREEADFLERKRAAKLAELGEPMVKEANDLLLAKPSKEELLTMLEEMGETVVVEPKAKERNPLTDPLAILKAGWQNQAKKKADAIRQDLEKNVYTMGCDRDQRHSAIFFTEDPKNLSEIEPHHWFSAYPPHQPEEGWWHPVDRVACQECFATSGEHVPLRLHSVGEGQNGDSFAINNRAQRFVHKIPRKVLEAAEEAGMEVG